MTTVCVIQARMSSTRLPGKVLLKLGSLRVIDHVVNGVHRSAKVDKTIVAMSDLPEDDILEKHCQDQGYTTFRGSESNVLSRFVQALTPLNPELVIRVTGDCPFIDPTLIDALIDSHLKQGNDFTATSSKDSFPLGFHCEAFPYRLLKEASEKASSDYELEHVTPYFYKDGSGFKVGYLSATESQKAPQLRLTLDTPEDYELIKATHGIFQYFQTSISLQSIVALYKLAPAAFASNQQIQQKTIRSSFAELKKESLELLSSYGLNEAVEFMEKNWSAPS